MIDTIKQCLWKNFGASIDMLSNSIELAPENYLYTNKKFFYMAYHTLVFLDYYLAIPPRNFSSPLPYTLTEPAAIPADAIDDVVPNKIYSKKELLGYAQTCREKCRNIIAALTEENVHQPWIDDPKTVNLDLASFDSLKYTVLEILLYNMRHVQHHAAQLNLLLRQTIDKAPDYVSQAVDDL